MAVFLAAANLCVTMLDLWRAPHASEAVVNPRDRRAMPEYVAARPVSDGRPLAVLISNSQGAYSGDDASVLYPALLQKRWKTMRLENWSTDGIRPVETELLTRQALRRGAELIIIVLGATSIDPPRLATIDYGNTDIDLLLGEPPLWWTLRGGLTYAHLDRDQFAARLLRAHVPLVRARTALRDELATLLPESVQRPLFGRRLDFLIRGLKSTSLAGRAAGMRQHNTGIPFEVDDAELEPQLTTLETLVTSLHAEAARVGTRVIWCWQPVGIGRLSPEMFSKGARLYELSRLLFETNAIEFHDLASALTDRYFIDSTHFTRAGHAAMADLMDETLGHALR